MGKHSKIHKHTFKLQILDANAVPFPDLNFNYNVQILKKDNSIILQLPQLNFETYQIFSPDNQSPGNSVTGGLVNTMKHPLPEKFRPRQNQTFLLSINDQYLQSYDLLAPTPTTLPGLNLTIDTYGHLTISAPTIFQSIIPVGSHTLNAQSIEYLIDSENHLIDIKNFIIQKHQTDFSKFTGKALNDGIRDSHVNDSHLSTLAWAWTDNSEQTDKTNNVMDAYVAIAHINDKHDLKISKPIRLTNLSTGFMAWDTAIAINRINPKNIVASYGILDHNSDNTQSTLNVSVSNDGGKTWSQSINIDPNVTYFGDARGVIADKYGNFWFSSTSRSTDNSVINLSFYASRDGGLTWALIFQTNDSSVNLGQYDYPQVALGNNGLNQYGLWFLSDFYNADNNNLARLGFIPTNGLGNYGTPTYIILDNLLNQVSLCDLDIGHDGTVYMVGNPTINSYSTIYGANTLIKKAPGPLDKSLISQPYTILNTSQNTLPTNSYPIYNYTYFITTIKNTIYDNHRKALYVVFSEQPNGQSQDMYLYMLISLDKGHTWSPKIQLSSSHKNNRGFSSVSLNNGALSFGWYDSRNSKNSISEQYYGTMITKKQLDKLIKELK